MANAMGAFDPPPPPPPPAPPPLSSPAPFAPLVPQRAAPGSPRGRGVFISYRRGETSGQARALHEYLERRFGEHQVFMDVNSIAPGADFVRRIEDEISGCGVVLALIGRDWLGHYGGGSRMVDDPNDFVRLELGAALNRNVPVIPILVERTPMPQPQELPEPLRDITRRNALDLENTRWDYDVTRLADAVEPMLAKVARSPLTQPRAIFAGVAALVVVAIVVFFAFVVPHPPTDPLAKLISHVPQPLRSSCKQAAIQDVGATVEVACSPNASGVANVNYEVFPSYTAMNNAYQSDLPTQPGTGCNPLPLAANCEYNDNAGDDFEMCSTADNYCEIDWTNANLLILSWAQSTTSSLQDENTLFSWWQHDAGPS